MTPDNEKIIAELVNRGLDGDMDAVNSHDDKMVRAKVKAMIMKVKKGTAERPPMPQNTSEPVQAVVLDPGSLSKDDLVSYLINVGLDGDMDAVNSHDDKMVRAKVKATIMKVNKGTAERPPMPKVASEEVIQTGDEKDSEQVDIDKNAHDKVKELLLKKFPDSLIENEYDSYVQIKAKNWYEIALMLKTEKSLLFDSLQCQMGMDMGEDILESRYNLHSMEHDHYTEIRIAVSRSSAQVPSVEQIWRIADWFERETYDMLGIEYVGHRDLRRILLPDDWEGWPLRKDYQEQETYHGIMVPKMKEGWE